MTKLFATYIPASTSEPWNTTFIEEFNFWANDLNYFNVFFYLKILCLFCLLDGITIFFELNNISKYIEWLLLWNNFFATQTTRKTVRWKYNAYAYKIICKTLRFSLQYKSYTKMSFYYLHYHDQMYKNQKQDESEFLNMNFLNILISYIM